MLLPITAAWRRRRSSSARGFLACTALRLQILVVEISLDAVQKSRMREANSRIRIEDVSEAVVEVRRMWAGPLIPAWYSTVSGATFGSLVASF